MLLSVKAEVKELAKEVPLGTSLSVVCPFCERAWREQGRPVTWKPNRSFTMTREPTGVLYHCFRNSCKGSSGFIPDITLEHIPKKEFKPMVYEPSLYALLPEQRKFFIDKGFTEREIADAGIKYCKDRDTYVFDIRDYHGHTVGYVDRDFNNKRDPKAITYWFNNVPKLHFPVTPSNPIIVVEDIPSAIKAARFMSSAALLGSSLTVEQVKHLRQITDTIYLALDEDATATAVKLQKRYGFYFRNFTVLPLSKDIKDMNENELIYFSRRI